MKKLMIFVLVFVAFGLITGCDNPSGPITEEEALKKIDQVLNQIEIPDIVEGDVNRVILPNNKKDVYFTWTSSDETVMTNNGHITHDWLYDQSVTLTVLAEYKGYSKTKDYPIIIKNTDADTVVEGLLAGLKLPESVSEDITLVNKLTYNEVDFDVIWESSNENSLSNTGEFKATVKEDIDLVAKIIVNGKTYERTFEIKVYPRTVYEIKTIQDFVNINNDLDGLYYLMNDLDFTSQSAPVIGSVTNAFTGIFRGQGHKLNNITLILTNDTTAIFNVNEGIIDKVALLNLTINGTVTNQAFIGGLVGLNKGLVDQCYLDGKMTLTVNRMTEISVGGFVGEVVEGEITNSISSVVLELTLTNANQTTLNVGGFVGKVEKGLIRHSIYEDQPNYSRNPKGRSILVKNAQDNTVYGAMFVGRVVGDAMFVGSFGVGAIEVAGFDPNGVNTQKINNFASEWVNVDAFVFCFVLDTCYMAGREGSVNLTFNQMSTSTMVTEDWYNYSLKFDEGLWDYSPIHDYSASTARLKIFN